MQSDKQLLKSFLVPLSTRDENDYVIVSGTDCEREPEFIPDGPKNALHHILQVRGHRLPEYSSVRDGESNWTATAILHISRHKTISVKGEMHPKKKVAESNAAQMMLDSDDFKEYLKHLDKQ
ncbi:uncharacterized protein LOC134820230 [Bolinopsis microptera]|uniref:uncharacterized protein LOC134819109 n=1 Tax=Bolinopsis microptera TaxID=2820187 RepID=UPI0030797C80